MQAYIHVQLKTKNAKNVIKFENYLTIDFQSKHLFPLFSDGLSSGASASARRG